MIETRYEIRDNGGTRVGRFLDLQDAVDECRSINANRDEGQAYVVFQVLAPVPIGE